MRTQWLHHSRKVNLYILCSGLLLLGLWSITFAVSQRKKGSPKDTLYEIAFVRSDGIWAVNSDGSHLRKLYPLKTWLGSKQVHDKRITCAPAWSPTGDQLCFGDNKEERLVVINRSGRVLRKIALLPYDPSQKSVYELTHKPGSESYYVSFQKVVWTPRTNLIMAEYRESEFIYNVLAWDRHKTQRIGPKSRNIDVMDVSQDGQWVVYVEGRGYMDEEISDWMGIFLENLKTHRRQRVYYTKHYPVQSLGLSPDGKQICFTRAKMEGPKGLKDVDGLWMIGTDKQLRQLTRTSSLNYHKPLLWSPNSRWIAFENIGGTYGIYLYDLKEKKVRLLGKYGLLSDWTPDSRYIITGGPCRIAVPSGKMQEIVPDGYYPSVRPGRK
jgi:Tol biopolymer transport system component